MSAKPDTRPRPILLVFGRAKRHAWTAAWFVEGGPIVLRWTSRDNGQLVRKEQLMRKEREP